MLDKGIFDSYNKYIFQMGSENEFAEWKNSNNTDYEKFIEWYTNENNNLKIQNKNKFIKE